MTPDLSRRIAAAVHALPAGEKRLLDRARLERESHECDEFEQLPVWIREIVERGEALMKDVDS